MNPKPITTPKDFFLNLGWLVALYGSIISLINLLFETINREFPDAVNGMYYYAGSYSSAIRWSIACIIVFFPVYIILTKYIRKIIVIDPSKKELWVRKWFVYLTLFLGSVTMLVDLITLINIFLGGELTTRFILKVIAIIVVIGIAFGYYIYDLRKEGMSNKVGKIFAWTSVILVIASLVWAFMVIGSPANERARRFDEQRVSDLQNIQYQILNYWQTKGVLPTEINQLADSFSGFVVPKDPEFNSDINKDGYTYLAKDKKVFELCANFNLANNSNANSNKTAPVEFNLNDYWQHSTGRTCFERTIDETRYPMNIKAIKI